MTYAVLLLLLLLLAGVVIWLMSIAHERDQLAASNARLIGRVHRLRGRIRDQRGEIDALRAENNQMRAEQGRLRRRINRLVADAAAQENACEGHIYDLDWLVRETQGPAPQLSQEQVDLSFNLLVDQTWRQSPPRETGATS
jgi:cell division protein FtsB